MTATIMAVVSVAFSPLPAHVRTARLVASAVARRGGVAEDLLDELRFAVGEACARAVDLHRRFAPTVPVRLELIDEPGRFQVTVSDVAPAGEDVSGADRLGAGDFDPHTLAASVPHQTEPAGRDAADFLPAGFGLAIIEGLVDDIEVSTAGGGEGTVVRMVWPVSRSAPSTG